MIVTFKAITPLFTGDKATRQQLRWGGNQATLRTTSMIGSLRFWAGAVARGLGYEVPSATGKNLPTIKTAADAEALDPVTFLFGCTGWRKAFHLRLATPAQTDLLSQISAEKDAHVLTSKHGWYIKPGLFHKWDKSIQAVFSIRDNIPQQKKELCFSWLRLLWQGVDKSFPLGAHQGWGYGWVKTCAGDEMSEYSLPGEGPRFEDPMFLKDSDLPDLADFIFAEYAFKENLSVQLKPLGKISGYFENGSILKWDKNLTAGLPIPIGLSLRYALRYGKGAFNKLFKNSPGDDWDKFFFGGARDGLPAGRFNCSMLFKTDKDGNPTPSGTQWRFRLWAWFPKKGTPSSWCDAAERLRKAMKDSKLWAEIIKPNVTPEEIYFWPLAPGRLVDAGNNSKFYSVLELISRRMKKILERTCVP